MTVHDGNTLSAMAMLEDPMEQPRPDGDEPTPDGDEPTPDEAGDRAPSGAEPRASPGPSPPPPPASDASPPGTSPAPAGDGWARPPQPEPAARLALPKLPVEATLRMAMDDVGTGFWRLVAVGAIGFAPIWAAMIVLGDNPLSSVVQLLAIVPSAALLAAAGALRADLRPSIAGSYRAALTRLLHYVLANILVGIIVLLIMIVPLLIAAVAIAVMLISGTSDASGTVAIVLLMTILVLIPVAWVTARLALVGPLVVVEGLGVGEAVAEGWRRTRGQVLRLLAVFVIGSIPGLLVALGATLLAFGLLSQPIVIGLVFGLGYAVAMMVITCLDVVAWERLGGIARSAGGGPAETGLEANGTPPGPSVRRRSDRGPMTAVLLLVLGLALLIGGSAAAVGKVDGWIAALAGQSDGEITYGVNGVGCYQLDERSEFQAGETIHLVADLTMAIPAGQRLGYEVYADGELIDRGYEEPFAEETECVYYDLDTTDIEPAAYTFRYLWAAETVAEGTFIITP